MFNSSPLFLIRAHFFLIPAHFFYHGLEYHGLEYHGRESYHFHCVSVKFFRAQGGAAPLRGQGKFNASQGKVKARSGQGQGKAKARSEQG